MGNNRKEAFINAWIEAYKNYDYEANIIRFIKAIKEGRLIVTQTNNKVVVLEVYTKYEEDKIQPYRRLNFLTIFKCLGFDIDVSSESVKFRSQYTGQFIETVLEKLHKTDLITIETYLGVNNIRINTIKL